MAFYDSSRRRLLLKTAVSSALEMAKSTVWRRPADAKSGVIELRRSIVASWFTAICSAPGRSPAAY